MDKKENKNNNNISFVLGVGVIVLILIILQFVESGVWQISLIVAGLILAFSLKKIIK